MANPKLNYLPQLDALRSFAVFLVLIQHFPGPFPSKIKYGAFGVQLFFVLSGYLITRILLVGRAKAESGASGKGRQILLFYIRRALRIFPLFYFVLLFTAFLNIPPVRETFWWHFFYASNFYLAQLGDWNGCISHLWTLAVEEQFYFVWPCLIFFVPQKHLLKTIVFFVAVGPVFRFMGALTHMNEVALITLPFSNIDSLGLGALLGYLSLNAKDYLATGRKLALAGFFVALPAYAVDFILRKVYDIHSPFQSGYSRTCLALFFVGVIFHASIGLKGIAGKVLSLKPLIYIGKISYGLYIYHNFVPFFVERLWPVFGLEPEFTTNGYFLVHMTATFLIAALSWHLLEKPLNDLKRHF
jgi:peptidoglycan/LPS O-acetylase OafA/YrhL